MDDKILGYPDLGNLHFNLHFQHFQHFQPQPCIFSIPTLWLCQNSYWKWPLIVDFPINSMVIFHSYVKITRGYHPHLTCRKRLSETKTSCALGSIVPTFILHRVRKEVLRRKKNMFSKGIWPGNETYIYIMCMYIYNVYVYIYIYIMCMYIYIMCMHIYI